MFVDEETSPCWTWLEDGFEELGVEDEVDEVEEDGVSSDDFMRRIWFTVSWSIAHLSGLTESEDMSSMLAEMSSASSSM